MGAKKQSILLDGVTGTGASSAIDIGEHQKTLWVHWKGASTPSATLAVQFQDPDGDWENAHSEAITDATKVIQIDNPAAKKWRANLTAYTSGTIDVFAYWC